MCLVSAVAKRVVGNITGAVDDEAPLLPSRLTGAMRTCGFRHARLYGASFSHNRTPIPVAKVLNATSYPLLNFPVIKYLAWMCLFYGQKSSD
jgi:hypothetical protein